MNRTIGYILAFTAGAAVGVAASYKLLKKHFERITQEEIDSFYATVSPDKKADKTEEQKLEEREEVKKANLEARQEYSDILSSTGYAGKEVTEKEVADVTKPYVITDAEFAALDETEYDILTLTYYADGILSDDADDIIYDIDDIVGEDSLSHFDDIDDNGKTVDTIYVINDELGTAYEILRDNREYESASRKLYRETHRDDEE